MNHINRRANSPTGVPGFRCRSFLRNASGALPCRRHIRFLKEKSSVTHRKSLFYPQFLTVSIYIEKKAIEAARKLFKMNILTAEQIAIAEGLSIEAVLKLKADL